MDVMRKRGQVAMEFLMTYGWAIIIILLAIAALWLLGVFNFDTPSKCTISAPFNCQDVLVETGGITVKMALTKGYTGSVKSFLVNGEQCDQILGGDNLEGGQVKNVRCVKPGLEQDAKVSASVGMSYKKVGGFSQETEGAITGEVKPTSQARTGDPSLVLAYDFEDGAKDLSTLGNDGVITGADCSVSGKEGKGCRFSGTANIKAKFVEVYAKGTYTAWIKLDSFPTAAQNYIIWVGDDSAWGRDEIHVKVHSNDQYSLVFSDEYQVNKLTAPLSTNWHHVAATWDTVAGVSIIYIDGTEVARGQTRTFSADKEVTLVGNRAEGTGPFLGVLDDVVIYDRVLSPAEISTYAKG